MTETSPHDARRAGDILVVDDNMANLIAIEAALGPLSPRVVRAQSGGEAVRLAAAQDFTVILMDVQMPIMDGLEAARRIRDQPRSAHTPIIFVTAYSQDDADVLAGYRLGAVDFLAKPIVTEALRAKVNVFVELQRRASELTRQSEQLREHERREHDRLLQEERSRWKAEAMQEEVAAMAEADRRKDEFLAMLGHELRNPLAAVALGLELVHAKLAEAFPPQDKIHATHGRINQQVGHLARLVDDLLDLARINSGTVRLHTQPIVLAEVIDSAVAVSRPLIEQRKHKLELELPAEPIRITADPVRLTQVVANLLNNAARFTAEGGTIALRCQRAPGGVDITVTDNGCGISPALLPRVFEMFVQEEHPRGGGGLGLGLTIVKRMVELHGGTVSARSAGPGQGCEFKVRLPIEPAKPAPAPAAVPAPARSLRIALVEDSADIREMTSELLTILGHEVHSAADGERGVELILSQRPDVALIDMGLPGLDGCGVAARVRARFDSSTIRLVAMTGFGLDSDRQRAREAGFDDYLVKPADLDALVRALSPSG